MTALTATLKQQLFNLPMLPKLMAEFANYLELERQKRNAFYEWITPDMKAEFINGEIIEHSPASETHKEIAAYLYHVANAYTDSHDLGVVRYEKAMINLTRNDYEPDVAFWKKAKATKFDAAQTHYPAPDWVVEILSDSTAKRDRGVKFDDYAAHGIKEYWIIDSKKKTVEQYLLEGESYELHRKLGIEDRIESKVIKDFCMHLLEFFDKEALV